MRIFADVLGRFLPRLSFLTAHSPLTPLLVSAIKALGKQAKGGASSWLDGMLKLRLYR